MGVYGAGSYGLSVGISSSGIEYFYQSSKPTTRPGGAVLEVGDRWWKTSNGTDWYWNGTYWLSPSVFSSGRNLGAISITNTPLDPRASIVVLSGCTAIFVHRFGFNSKVGTGGYTANTTDWTVELLYGRASNNEYPFTPAASVKFSSVAGNVANENFEGGVEIGQAFNVIGDSTNGMRSFRVKFTKTGLPSNIDEFNYWVETSSIHP